MDSLPPLENIGGGHSAYCGVCWFPVFRLWVAAEAPDYTRCPIGDYTAQTCPNPVGEARLTAFLASLPCVSSPEPNSASDGSTPRRSVLARADHLSPPPHMTPDRGRE